MTETYLIGATLLLLAVVIAPRLSVRWPLWVRFVWNVGTLATLTFLVQRSFSSPLAPRFILDNANQRLWQQCIEIGWWLLAARVSVKAARFLVVLENRPRETKIVSDLLAGGLYVATVLAIVNFAFAVPVGGLLATSGVIAIVLGLALQSTLSDVFSGIAVGLEKPYKAGDLIWVEGDIEGHVTQVNWRSTHIATGQSNIAVVPNSVIAKARLINRNAPTTMRGDMIRIKLDARATPEHCLATLTAAVKACRTPLATPAPDIVCTGLQGDGVTYEITFSVPSSAYLSDARTELFTSLHRHLRHAGIALAVPGVTNLPEVPVPTPAQLLEDSDLFGAIQPKLRDFLATHFTPEYLQPGETLIRKGEMPDALFVIASGTAEVTIPEGAGSRILRRISPGESIGAVSLIMGIPFAATATALTPLRSYRLSKPDIAAAIKAMPELAAGLEALAARGQAALQIEEAEHPDAEPVHSEWFLTRLRSFVHLLST